MSDTTDTPRTDTQCGQGRYIHLVDKEFARQLERELAAATRERDEWKAEVKSLRRVLEDMGWQNEPDGMAAEKFLRAFSPPFPEVMLRSEHEAEVGRSRRAGIGPWITLPNEQGLWWGWCGDGDSAPCIYRIGKCSNGTFFACLGQYGWKEPRGMDDFEGYVWAKAYEPAVHEVQATLATKEEPK